MKKLLALLLALTLGACSKSVTVSSPGAFEIPSSEGTTCAQVTKADPGAPTPNCQQLYEAFVRGRDRMEKVWPQSASVTMGTFNFDQTTVQWNATETFPRMLSGPEPGAIAVTSSIDCKFVWYAWPQSIEHEAAHMIGCVVIPNLARSAAAIALPKDADQAGFTLIREITCHNTSDDPIGDGTSISSSGRASCISVPYSGPANPLLPTPSPTASLLTAFLRAQPPLL